jgi:NAD(P)-dependent dehydrogenase (short-subunit alcohol dehydrogenase family)
MPKIVLITGVSSGIGRLTAELMASRGWQVAATSREPKDLADWAAQHHIHIVPLDVTDEASITTAIGNVIERFGGIDVLVNNAGYGLFGPLEGATPEDVELQFHTNVFGCINLIRQVMPIMRKQHSGTIINVSSVGGRVASPFASLYHASKFAIEGFSESFRYEAALHGVRVKLVEPAHFKTDFINKSLQLAAHQEYETQFNNYMQWVYLEDRTSPTAEPVAQVILKAAEDGSSRFRYLVNGAVMLALIRLLPDAIWRSLNEAGFTRRPKDAPVH